MIKAIMLICSPAATWERVALDKEDFRKLIALFLFPLLLVTIAVQMAGWIYWGRMGMVSHPVRMPAAQGINFGLIQLGMDAALVLICSFCVKSAAKTFHRRNTFSQAFCLTAHTLAPFFMACMLDAIPEMSPYATFGIAISLSLSALYYGVPRVLEPDPPSAFGIYFVCALMFFGIAGLARLIYFVIVAGRPHFAAVG